MSELEDSIENCDRSEQLGLEGSIEDCKHSEVDGKSGDLPTRTINVLLVGHPSVRVRGLFGGRLLGMSGI